jgi:hypothetical protein
MAQFDRNVCVGSVLGFCLCGFCALAMIVSGGTRAVAEQSRKFAGKLPTDLSEGDIEWSAADVQVRSDPRFRKNCKAVFKEQCTIEIMKGTSAAGLHPNVVAILNDWTDKTKQKILCSGTLIAEGVVLTAGHCIDLGVRDFLVFGDAVDMNGELQWQRNNFVITASGSRTAEQESRESRSSLTQHVVQIARYTRMKPMEEFGNVTLDIALIQTKEGLPHYAQIAKIATPNEINESLTLRAVGFGLTESGLAGEKRRADVIVASPSCDGSVTPGKLANPDSDAKWYRCMKPFELVAGRLERFARLSAGAAEDTCTGDSGGPLFFRRPSADDATGAGFVVAAVTSRAVSRLGLNDGRISCGDGGIYTRLDGLALRWVNRVLSKDWNLSPIGDAF